MTFPNVLHTHGIFLVSTLPLLIWSWVPGREFWAPCLEICCLGYIPDGCSSMLASAVTYCSWPHSKNHRTSLWTNRLIKMLSTWKPKAASSAKLDKVVITKIIINSSLSWTMRRKSKNKTSLFSILLKIIFVLYLWEFHTVYFENIFLSPNSFQICPLSPLPNNFMFSLFEKLSEDNLCHSNNLMHGACPGPQPTYQESHFKSVTKDSSSSSSSTKFWAQTSAWLWIITSASISFWI